mgnify:CR=1 FL=1
MGQLWKSVEEVLEYAMAEEQKAVALYRLFAEQSPSDELRTLFGGLVTAEMGHFKKLAKMRRATEATLVARRLHRLPRPPATSLLDAGIADVASAYRYAIRAEKQAQDLYAMLAGMATEPKVRDAFQMLADEELGHKSLLEADLEKRQSKGGFLKRLFRLAPKP